MVEFLGFGVEVVLVFGVDADVQGEAFGDVDACLLQGVDFFGVVGRNGSGKSTMLKILAGVYQPTSGSIQLHGKLTPFIELGVGFNPELSRRDNIFLN